MKRTLLALSIQAITLAFILLWFLFPQWLQQQELYLAAALMILLGIPHGATDHLLFLRLSGPVLGAKGLQQFYRHYLLLLAAYGLMWWLTPMLALGIFLFISAYHFGQSNWSYLALTNRKAASIMYLCWGAFVLGMPIGWHWEAAAPIISSITGWNISLSFAYQTPIICLGLFILNTGIAIYSWRKGVLSQQQLWVEISQLLLLSVLFVTTPLLLGFTIYFVFWHSLSSVVDQIDFFNRQVAGYTWKNYLWHTLPLSLIAFAGLSLLFGIKVFLGLPVDIGLLFIFIAVITLPHMLLIEKLYEELNKSGELLDIKT